MTNKKTEALKLSLEALEVATTPLARDRQEVLRAQAAIREALSEQPAQQQEPVGEVTNERGEIDWISFVPPAGTSLYTSPPASKPLPVEKIAELDCNDHYKLARAIEAAHGITEETNNG